MTYVNGNNSKVESMSLPRKAIKPNSKVILIDDFYERWRNYQRDGRPYE